MRHNKKIYWDLDDKFEISSPIIRNVIFKKKLTMRKQFCNWIEKISANHTKDLDWWLTIPSSRNPYLSNLFDSICILETLDILLKKEYIIHIKTSSKNLFQVLQETKFVKKKNLKIFLKEKKEFKKFAFVKTIIFYSILFFYIKFFSKKIDLSKKHQCILVETYLLLNFKNKENFNKNIFRFNNKNLFLVPNFLQQKNLKLIFKKINSIDKSKYIFRENYLSVFDLIFSLLHIYRKKKFVSKHKKFNRWNLSPIINGEINSSENYYSAVIGVANLRFFENLNKKKIHLSKIISLFENQAASRGWCYGSRKFFSEIDNIGYQGYFNYSQFLNSHPCIYEEKAKILPKEIAIISKYFKKNKREFFPRVKLILAPPLNFKIEQKNLIKKNKYVMVLILSGIKEIDRKLIFWCLKFLEEDKNIKLVIKFHPISHPDNFELNIINNFKGRVIISKQDIDSLLNESKIIISSGPTSSIYEALFKKCYLLIPVFDPCDRLNIENCKIPKQNYELVYNFQKFRYKLKYMLKKINNKKLIMVKNHLIFKNDNSKILNIFK